MLYVFLFALVIIVVAVDASRTENNRKKAAIERSRRRQEIDEMPKNTVEFSLAYLMEYGHSWESVREMNQYAVGSDDYELRHYKIFGRFSSPQVDEEMRERANDEYRARIAV